VKGGGGLAALSFSAQILLRRKKERWKERRGVNFTKREEKNCIVPVTYRTKKKREVCRNDLHELLSIFRFPHNRITENTYTKQNTVIILVTVELFSMSTYSTGTEQE
jgi:hypothetical protein